MAAGRRDSAKPHAATEPPRELEDLGLAFRRVFRALSRMRGRDTHLRDGELSHAQYELLIELQERGELSAGELAAAARLSPGTVTEMLDALAQSGHVERDRSRSDRRIVVSRLTPRGAARIAAKRAAWQERWQAALAGFGPRELKAATKVLQALGEMFDEASGAGASETRENAPADTPNVAGSPAARANSSAIVAEASRSGRRSQQPARESVKKMETSSR